jgi:HEAT repeats
MNLRVVEYAAIVEVCLLGAALVVLFMGHYLLASRHAEFIRQFTAVRANLTSLAVDGVGNRSTTKLFVSLSPEIQVRLLSETAERFGGKHRARLKVLADNVGLTRRAEKWCRSRLQARRLRGIRTLKAIGSSSSAVLKLFTDSNDEVRTQAAAWAFEHPTADAITGLLRLLDDPVRLCRMTAQDSLLRLGHAPVPQLTECLARMKGRSAEAALQVAAALAHPRLLPPIIERTSDTAAGIRAAATEALGFYGGELACRRVIEMLDDQESEVRLEAIRSIKSMQYWPAAANIVRRLSDPSGDVRREAAVTLAKLGAPGILLLRNAALDSNREASEVAKQALSLCEAGGESLP